MKQEVAEAIEELKRAFPASDVSGQEDGEGGAHVIVEDVALGSRYQPPSTWVGAHVPALYPYADIYPLFIAASVRRADGVAFEPPVTAGAQFLGRPALQVSRRNNHTQHYPQTAVSKFVKVLHFLEELP